MEGVPAKKAGWITRVIYWFVRRQFGTVLEPITMYAHHPHLLRAYAKFELGLQKCRLVPEKLKCLAQLHVAGLVGCPF